MARKEKVSILRTEDFASVEDELSAALERLESANSRVLDLLAAETAPSAEDQPTPEAGIAVGAPPGGDTEAAPAP